MGEGVSVQVGEGGEELGEEGEGVRFGEGAGGGDVGVQVAVGDVG